MITRWSEGETRTGVLSEGEGVHLMSGARKVRVDETGIQSQERGKRTNKTSITMKYGMRVWSTFHAIKSFPQINEQMRVWQTKDRLT